jgi:hypothetical protein
MDKITLDPSSLLAGAALTVVATLAMGAQPAAPPAPFAASAAALSIPGSPSAKDMVYLRESKDDAGFTVPEGRYLVITGVGQDRSPTLQPETWTAIQLTVGSLKRSFSLTGPELVHDLGTGIAVEAGEKVVIGDSSKRGFAFLVGYLEDA